ncbi:MAG: OmpA family protein [Candidatus Omnitrophica bacterium]|nr:OmpA family protein [Candidatus Omnitrophota bacterium]
MNGKLKYLVVIALMISLTGCSVILQKRSPGDLDRIDDLAAKLSEEQKARAELMRARDELEEKLKKEIEEKQIRLEMLNKGLVITFVDEVLFDSGKADIKKQAFSILDRVAKVLNDQVRNRNIAIEGHTDNQPISKSKWKSNWELSTARSISVLHYLVDQRSLAPERLSAVGYGEFQPVLSNETPEGRQQNRRVEITILPEKIIKKKPGELK